MRLRLAVSLILGFLWSLPAHGDAIAAALADANRLPADVQAQARYLDLSNLPTDYRETAVRVLCFQTNSLSRSAELVAPAVVSAEVLRVQLIDYGWQAKVWEKLAEIDPYYHQQSEIEETESWGFRQSDGSFKVTEQRPTGKKVKSSAFGPWTGPALGELSHLTGSAAPIVRADWWFVQTARQLSLSNQQTGGGYYDFLGIKDRADFEKLIRLDQKASIDIGREMRAAVDHSGVSAQNRQIVRFQALTGAAWMTQDTDNATDKGNAIRNLKRGAYQHQAEEWIADLPNGLKAHFLGNAGGDRQDSAPDFIGEDSSPLRTGRDARIHVHLACVRCHSEDGLRPIDDWARRQGKAITSPVYAELLDLRRQYFSNLTRQLDADRRVYRNALRDTNGWTSQENARQFARFWDRYTADVGPDEAALELGVSVAMLRKTFAVPYPEPQVAGLAADPPVKLPRVAWEELYGTAAMAMKGKH